MKIQRRSLVKEIKAHQPLILSEPIGFCQPLCNKLYTKPLNDWKNVDSFLKLRQLRLEKTTALLHSCKKQCRHDLSIPAANNKAKIIINEEKCENNKSLKNITKEMIFICNNSNRLDSKEILDASFQKLNDIQDKSAQEYQEKLNKFKEDSIIIDKQHSYNLQQLTRQQLFDKLKNINNKTPTVLLQNKSVNLQTEKSNISIDVIVQRNNQVSLRKTTDKFSIDISPLLPQDSTAQNSPIKQKLQSLIKPCRSQRKVGFNNPPQHPYFAKNTIRLNNIFVTTQANACLESESNLQATNDSNLTSLIRNKSTLLTREMKRIRILTEN